MRQNIPVHQLAPGMKIVSLDIGWNKSPKWTSPFILSSGEDLALLLQHCRVVSVETPAQQPEKNTLQQPEKNIPQPPVSKPASSGNLSDVSNCSPKNKHPGLAPEEVFRCFRDCLDMLSRNFDRVRFGQDIDSASILTTTDKLMQASAASPQALLLLSELEQKDNSLERKSLDIAILCLCFGNALGLSGTALRELGMSALLHDIGMIKMSASLLQKGRSITPAERQLLHKHVNIGCNLLHKSPELRPLIKTVAQHHERFDGLGYPTGIKGDKIPLAARILSIAAIYNTLTRARYASPHAASTQALRKLYSLRDRHVDGQLVIRFIRFLGIYPVGTLVELNRKQIGMVVNTHQQSRSRPVVQRLYSVTGESLKPSAPIDLSESRFQSIQVTASLQQHQITGFSGQAVAQLLGFYQAA